MYPIARSANNSKGNSKGNSSLFRMPAVGIRFKSQQRSFLSVQAIALRKAMPRKLLMRTSDFPYHVTNRANNRESFYIDQALLWPIFIKCLHQLTIQFKCEIHSFVLMKNHYHLIISTPEANIGDAMKYLHREVAREVNRFTGRVNHFFGGRYKWSVISENNYYWNCIKYVFRNPVRAGICNDVQTYQFSSLNREAHLFKWSISGFFLDSKQVVDLNIDWLNEPFRKEVEEFIRKGLRRREFQLPKDSLRKRAVLDVPLYKKGTVT